MANTTGWVSGRGQGLTTYGSAGFTVANFNSLASGSVVVATTTIANGTPLDLYTDVSFSIVVGGTTTATSRFDLYLLPLNQDNSTYGDNTANGATPPASTYQVSSCVVLTGVASGSAVVGTFRGIVMPPGSFRFAMTNQLGVALNAAAAAVVNYRTYNENLNA